jgi:hypothetical protein
MVTFSYPLLALEVETIINDFPIVRFVVHRWRNFIGYDFYSLLRFVGEAESRLLSIW